MISKHVWPVGVQCIVSLFATLSLALGHPLLAQTAAIPTPAPWPAIGLSAPIIPAPFGINAHASALPPPQESLFLQAGYACARTDFLWNRIETKPGVYDFSMYDSLIPTYIDHGVRPMLVMAYGNKLYDGGKPPYDQAGFEAFAKMAGAAAAHFKGHGIFYEIWNEPNGGNPNWHMSPENYTAMAILAAKAIHANDPTATVFGPASSRMPWDYYQTCFKEGLLNAVDAVSIHPYRDASPDTAAPYFAKLSHLIAAYTPAGKPIRPVVVSEWGYSSQTPGGLSLDEQARYEIRMWLSDLSAGVPLSVWYDWHNDGPTAGYNEDNFGNVTFSDYQPKPNYLAAQALISSLDGYFFVHNLDVATPTDHKMLFCKGADIATVSWSSDPAASDAAQTPVITHVAPSDPDYAALRRSACVQYDASPVEAKPGQPGKLLINLQNSGKSTASIEVHMAGKSESAHLAPGASRTVEVSLPVDLVTATSGEASIPVNVRWDDEPVTHLPPVLLQASYPLFSVIPSAKGINITLGDLDGGGFHGKISVVSGTKIVATNADLAPGAQKAFILAADPAQDMEIIARSSSGALAAKLGPVRFEPIPGFPMAVGDGAKGPFHLIQTVKATPKQQQNYLSTTAVDPGPDAPVAAAMSVAIPSEPNLSQTVISEWSPVPIPPTASSIVYWEKSDGDGLPQNAVFSDSSGQNFQPHLPNLTWTGWQPITIPLDGEMWHWGGAKDGIPKGPFDLHQLLLIDSSKSKPTAGNVEVAAPYFAIGNASEPEVPGT